MQNLTEAAQDVLRAMTSSYRARNGREVGIEADDGEKCYIVHSDQICALERALTEIQLGFVVANGQQDMFRSWLPEGPSWTKVKRNALMFLRREDAERFADEDPDGWFVLPVTAFDLV
jgi:hypothetical protein